MKMIIKTGSAILLFLFAGYAQAQDIKILQLKNEKMDYKPRTYYINMVGDERNEKDRVGRMTGSGKADRVLMQGSASTALSKYLTDNMKQDAKLQPIELRITKLNFDIKKKSDHWSVDGDFNLAFYIGERKLAELTGGTDGNIDTDPLPYIADFMRQTMTNDLKKFDNWWAQNRDRVAMASTVKVNFNIARSSDDNRVIVYTSQRKLTMTDFRGPIRQHNGNEMAETYSGNKFAYTAETVRGQLVVNYTVTPYFQKDESWFKHDDEDGRVLAHEQVHFDITALKTCELVNKARNTIYTKDNYRELLDKLTDQIGTETGQMQEMYDAETNHGISEGIQKQWETKVKKQLSEANCY